MTPHRSTLDHTPAPELPAQTERDTPDGCAASSGATGSETSSKRHTPFYCGSQRFDWKCYNCTECKKGYDETKRAWLCDLERKIDEAYMGDGTFDAETAKRMGEPEDCRVYNWRCPEFEQAPPREPAPTLNAANKPAYWITEWAEKRALRISQNVPRSDTPEGRCL